ncbi:MAG TPA: phosphotransferase [Geminicoccus sp.]|jgi:Ser/Thr protein kinase RdoA (MazF antagonist)|uniref:phosphotransferase enzyme family protein n=1 Tax=Geminicoccus sp. TaxID=2024832 RepID=UPI002E364EDF|nr:phosphotransferase [Geminicoccus sp.]HEX2528459.1 phosphotransferase [Geminicoccus sp.]
MYDAAFLKGLEEGLRSALPAWDLPTDAPLRLLTISENATFVADDERAGRRMVFRVHRPAYHTEEEIRSELGWIQALIAERAISTPMPLPLANGDLLGAFDDQGALRHVAAFEFISGAEPAASEDSVPWFRRLGAISARLHHHTRNWNRPGHFRRKTWDFDAMLGSRPLWGDWRDGLGLDEPGRAVLERTAAVLERRLRAYGHGPERFGLIHADLRLANLLVENDRLGIIDFDDCGFSWFMYDFAAAVSFFEHDPVVPALQAAWLDGYRSEAHVTPEDEAMMPVFLMLRRMLLTAWIASHAETPTAQEMGTPYTAGTVELAEQFLADHA